MAQLKIEPGGRTSFPLLLLFFPRAQPAPMASPPPAVSAVSDETRTCFLESCKLRKSGCVFFKSDTQCVLHSTPVSPVVVLPLIESILVRIVGHTELAKQNSNHILTRSQNHGPRCMYIIVQCPSIAQPSFVPNVCKDPPVLLSGW